MRLSFFRRDLDPHGKFGPLIGVSLLIVMILFVYMIYSSYREAISNAETTSSNYAAIIQARLEATLRHSEGVLKEKVSTIPLAALTKQAVPQYARELDPQLDLTLLHFPEVSGLRIFDADGDMLYTTDSQTIARVNIADRSFFRELREDLQNKTVFSEVLIARNSGKESIFIARAFRDNAGAFLGIINAVIELENFQRLFRELDVGPQGVVAVFRSDNLAQVLRMPPYNAGTNMPLPSSNPIPRAIASGGTQGTFEFAAATDSIVRIFSFRLLDGFPFFVSVGLATRDILASSRLRILAAGVAGLSLLLLLGFLLKLESARRAESDFQRMIAEKRNQALADANPAAVIVHRDGKIIYANDPAAREFGATASDELIGTSVLELVDPQYRANALSRAGQLMGESTHVPPLEQILVRRDGTRFAAEVKSSTLMFNGQSAIYTFILDISDRKRVQELDILYRLAIDSSPVPTAVNDMQGRILLLNPAFTNTFGYTLDDIPTVQDWWPRAYPNPNYRQEVVDSWGERLAVSQRDRTPFQQMEIVVRTKSGADLAVIADASSLASNETGIHVVTLQDITERKLLTDRLAASYDVLKTAIECIDHGISVYDKDGCLVLYNEHYLKASKDIIDLVKIGARFDDLIRATVERGVAAIAPSSTIDENVAERVAEFRCADGKVHVRRRANGQVLHVVHRHLPDGRTISFRTDVTKQLALESQLREAQKMDAIGKLTGGVAHDFNNLLAVIMGNLQLLDRRGLNDVTRERLLKPALRATARGSELTRHLLAFGRRQSLRPIPTQLAELRAGFENMLRRTLGETISWDWKFDNALALCMVDPAQLEAAILNLAINARDAMPQGGKIEIDARNVTIDEDRINKPSELLAGQYVAISVSESGHGMTPEVLAQVFEPFFTTKDVGQGTGLGLSMVYGFVKQSGGHVTIDSVPDVGTTVTLYLPQFEAQNTDLTIAETANSSTSSTFTGTVLIVEDQDDVRATAVMQLEDLGFDVLNADSGAEALSILLTHNGNIDLLFSDVVLGNNMNGPDMVEEAKRLNPNIKVIYVSGYAESMRGAGGNIEQDAYLLDKPYSQEQLVEALKEILGSNAV